MLKGSTQLPVELGIGTQDMSYDVRLSWWIRLGLWADSVIEIGRARCVSGPEPVSDLCEIRNYILKP